MSQLRSWFRPPRHVVTIFLVVSLISAGALIFLVRLLFEQDRTVEIQRRQERLEQAAERAASTMKNALTDLEHRMTARGEEGAPPPEGVLILDVRTDVIVPRPRGGLLYFPELPPTRPLSNVHGVDDGTDAARLVEAERLEFVEQNAAAAENLYERLAEGGALQPEVRFAARNRLGRTRRKRGDWEGALNAYDRLVDRDFRVEGLPAGLLGRAGRASVFEAAHRPAELQREAGLLAESLRSGRWRLLRAEYEYYSGLARSWLDASGASTPATELETEALARTEAAVWLWQEKPWKGMRADEPAALRVIHAAGQPVLAMWVIDADVTRAAVATRSYIEPLCRAGVPDRAFECTLTDREGRVIAGAAAPTRFAVTLTPATTGLPWGLQLFPSDPDAAIVSPRRGLLLWLLAVLAVVWGAGALFIMRALARELRVSRLQSDFVGAVSHEFRSPLSSIGQISEMLLTDRLGSDDLRRRSYAVLVRESARLRGLVEGLLEFGRLEAGRTLYQFEPLEIGSFIETLTAEFGERVGPAGYRIELTRPPVPIVVHADREALARAVTNLLDNAVKYSPDCPTIGVNLERDDGRVTISVCDRGLGIPAREQREIFERFVRGSNTTALRIKGTGIGLAMARHIAEAHGGEILLSSEPGEGSRFTIVLPETQ